MPVIESAIQRVRLTKKQHDRNEPQLSAYRTAVKSLKKLQLLVQTT